MISRPLFVSALLAASASFARPQDPVRPWLEWRAEKLAGMGYVAFAADMYGEGKTTEHPKEAGALAGAVRKDTKEWEARAHAAERQ